MGGGLIGQGAALPRVPAPVGRLALHSGRGGRPPRGLPLIGVAAAALALEPLGSREALALGLTLAGVTLAPRKA